MGSFGLGMGGGAEITRHAKKRWRQRVDNQPTHKMELTADMWESANPVIAPEADCDEQRVFPLAGQRDMLLCGKHKSSGVRITTVLYADYSRIENARRGDF